MADIALIGLGTMGKNILLNLTDNGFKVVAYNRTASTINDFMTINKENKRILPANSLEDMRSKLKEPAIILLMITAGKAVDDLIQEMMPLLKSGDILIDAGNSEYEHSSRRCQQLAASNIFFVGCGISGGEMGARHGASIMPGGNKRAWMYIKPILQTIAAKSTSRFGHDICCEWLGNDGCGHFVKMVHNGIQYSDMQLISEAYDLLRSPPLNFDNESIASVFSEWNEGVLDSYLVEITAQILKFREEGQSDYLVNKIADTASQKGTGKWTVIAGLQFGTPITMISESVFSRFLSGLRNQRRAASQIYNPAIETCNDLTPNETIRYVQDIRSGLYAAKILSYSQGFMLMRQVSDALHWDLDLSHVAQIWQSGCIIRSRFLQKVRDVLAEKTQDSDFLFAEHFVAEMSQHVAGLRRAVSAALDNEIPVPVLSNALAYLDGLRSSRLPANLIQAQRDYFGAHMIQLEGAPQQFVHINWTGHGGQTAATTYQL